MIQRGHLLQTFPVLGAEWIVRLDVKITNYNFRGYTSLLHLTTGHNCCSWGDRTPGVFFRGDWNMMQVSSAVNGDADFYQYFFNSERPVPGEWNRLEVSQLQKNGKLIYSIFINYKRVFFVENKNPGFFTNVKFYASDPWHEAQPAVIKNLDFWRYLVPGENYNP